MDAFVGTAGWAVSAAREAFPEEGSALQRYAAVLNAVEINTSFHRRHRPATWERWADSTPDRFRFAVKLPKTITHQAKLADASELLDHFAQDVAGLGPKLGVVLVQLPPSLAFDAFLVDEFFQELAHRISAPAACEPRHASWFEPDADALLDRLHVSRVAADPALSPVAAEPGGYRGHTYWRLHGSPAMYRSEYGALRVSEYAARMTRAGGDCWCMFDNTASSAAIKDALFLQRMLR